MRNGGSLVFWVSISILLFGAGAVWSPLFVGAVTNAKDIFEVCSYLATIAAAAAAIVSLNAWKKQFSTQSKYSEIRSLKSAYFEVRKISVSIKAHTFFRRAEEVESDDEVIKNLRDDAQGRYEDWIIVWVAYAKAWAESSHFIESNVLREEYSPQSVRALHSEYTAKLNISLIMGVDVLGTCKRTLSEGLKTLDDYFLEGERLFSDELRSTLD